MSLEIVPTIRIDPGGRTHVVSYQTQSKLEKGCFVGLNVYHFEALSLLHAYPTFPKKKRFQLYPFFDMEFVDNFIPNKLQSLDDYI